MAQAVTLIIFLFMMCLSCICLGALGGGVFYACSDGTMKPDEFDLKKCANFGIKDVQSVISGDIKDTTDLTQDTESNGGLIPDQAIGDGLISDQPIDDEAADPNLNFLDYFKQDRNAFSGTGVSVTAQNAAECAKICFSDDIDMPNEGEKCQGFVSDDGTYCKLYPTVDSVDGAIHSRHKAYRLKEGKEGGGTIAAYNTTRHATEYGPDGGPKQYGNRHDVRCSGGALSSFKFNKVGDQVNNSFVCVNSDGLVAGTEKRTPHNASGKKKGRNDMYYIDRHDVNCGNHFLKQWKLNQWSSSMQVVYTCSNATTPRPPECESLKAGGTTHHPHVGTWKGDEIKCPANKLLTQWKYTDGGVDYTCCPKP